ncbi:MAG: FtsH protease activity modulator HflK [Pseudomonadota bacterium]
MAWNEPGGGKDPWGNRNEQGPPDLDEAFRKLQNQLSGIFGGSGGDGGGGRGISASSIGFLLIAALVVYGLSGIYQVDEQERAVEFLFGKAKTDVVLPGLAWHAPIVETVEKVNVTRVNSHTHQALMLTEDENIVDVKLTVQYVINNALDYLVNVRDPLRSLDHATESALRHVVGSSQMNAVITDGREAIGIEVQDRLQSYLNTYGTGFLVSKVNIDESAPPAQVKDAFNDVQKAKEDEQRFINEANAFAEKVVPEAKGEAERLKEEAKAYRDRVIAQADGESQRFTKLLAEYTQAQKVTRDRLYIDAMEELLTQSSKVLVDVEGGNNLLYLPLDKIAQASAADPNLSRDTVRSIVDETVRDLSNRIPSQRRRDTR